MLDNDTLSAPQNLRETINNAYRLAEDTYVKNLLDYATLSADENQIIKDLATRLIQKVRQSSKNSAGIDSFLTEYSLSGEEGIALMCLAEALLRIPDTKNIDRLIKDKIVKGDWQSHRGQSQSFFVNATTWALMLTGKILAPEKAQSIASKA